jgi:hypothetical protein
LRGNPFFPFYPEFFGGQGWTDTTYIDSHGKGQSLWHLATSFWDMTMHPEYYGGEYFGPIFLMFVPLSFFWLKRRCHPHQVMWGFSLVILGFWFMVDPNIRFLFGILGILCVLSALTFDEMLRTSDQRIKVIFSILMVMTLGLQCLSVMHHTGKSIKNLAHHPSRDSYLRQHERTYGIARAFNEVPADKKILAIEEIRVYHFKQEVTLEGDFLRFTHYPNYVSTQEELHSYLAKKDFSYLLFPAEVTSGYPEPSYPLRLGNLYRDKKLDSHYFQKDDKLSDDFYTIYQVMPL